jgi:hypothetical protein
MGARRGLLAQARAAARSGPLTRRGFLLLTGGQVTSTVGDYCYAVALPWLVLSSHAGAPALGAVLACYGASRTVTIPVGGLLTDKIGARVLMLAADLTRCVLVAVLAFLAARHLTSVATLGPAAALIGAGEGLFLPASFAIMPSLVEEAQLQAANAISTAAVQTGALTGPALAGALVATLGSAPAFAVDAVTFAVSALSLALIGRPAAVPAPAADAAALPAGQHDGSGPGNGAASAPRSGGVWQLVRRERVLQLVLVVVTASNLASGGAFEVALPDLAHQRYGATGFGALLFALSLGTLAGTLTAARAGGLARPAIAASYPLLAGAAVLALTPFLGGLVGAAAAVLLFGAGIGFANIVFITALQKWTPVPMLGRVMSLVMLASIGTFPISVTVTGQLAGYLGPAPFFPIASALIGAAILGALTQRTFRLYGASEPAGQAATACEPGTQARSSPPSTAPGHP